MSALEGTALGAQGDARSWRPPLPQLWSEAAGARAQLVNVSENDTYRLDGPAGVYMLRVHRSGYHSRSAIESELAWLASLRAESPLRVPRPIPGRNGEWLQELGAGEYRRYAVLFAFEQGREPVPSPKLFRELGSAAARAHGHAQGFRLPLGFSRPAWTPETLLGADGIWGDWRQAPGVGQDACAMLGRVVGRVVGRLWADLADAGRERDGFGLIHADMRMANLLVDGDDLAIIDFDDCGFGWFGYDFAASISFLETSLMVPEWRDAWIEGYAAQGRMCAGMVGTLDALVMLRRMALLAWIGSHGETPLAQAHAPEFALGTADLAERYLSGRSL